MKLRVVPLLAWASAATAATVNDWRSRSIYQVMIDRYGRSDDSVTSSCNPGVGKYCGGSWEGLINNLDYIQNMGFTAVWISPITANLPQYTADLAAYHGYWQQNLYALNDNFGGVNDLQALSKALHVRNMYLMVDVCVNHFAWAGDHTTVQYDRLIPFNNASYYHDYCALTPTSSTTECWGGDDIVTLPDLKTEDDSVRSIWNTWISTFVKTYNVDGLRLDSAGNVETDFFPGFAAASTVFCTGEIYSGVPAYVCPYQKVMDSTLNYPVYFPLVRAFASASGSISDLVNEINGIGTNCKDPTSMLTFSENHDQPRFANYTSDLARAQNVLAFNVLADGIPTIYQGQEQHFSGGFNPVNREAVWLSKYNTSSPLCIFVTTLNIFRARVISVADGYLNYRNQIIYNDTSLLAMRKGPSGAQVVTVLTNAGTFGIGRQFSLSSNQTGFTSGTIVTDIVSCVNNTLDANGTLSFAMDGGLPKVFYAASHLTGTTICLNGITTNPNPVAINPPASGSERRLSLGAGHIMILAFTIGLCLI